jgi:hypothetical protein
VSVPGFPDHDRSQIPHLAVLFKAELRATLGEKVIGEGTHQRAIIDVSRFREKVAE